MSDAFSNSLPRTRRTSIWVLTGHRHLEERSRRKLQLQPGTVKRTSRWSNLIGRYLQLGRITKEASRGTSTATAMLVTMSSNPTLGPPELLPIDATSQSTAWLGQSLVIYHRVIEILCGHWSNYYYPAAFIPESYVLRDVCCCGKMDLFRTATFVFLDSFLCFLAFD